MTQTSTRESVTELALDWSPGSPISSPTAVPCSIVVAVHGELDIATAPDLERDLTATPTERVDQIILDLTGLGFMDAAGLHALERVCRHHRSCGRRIALRNVPPQVGRLFQLAGRAVEISLTG